MQLRPYQQKVKDAIYHAWNGGAKNVLAQLPTGAGKTVIFSNIIKDFSNQFTIAIAHRMELVSQISLMLGRYGIPHNLIAQKAAVREIVALHMQELKRSYYNPQNKCVVAGVDTLIKIDPATPWLQRVSLIVQDEGHHALKNNKWGRAAGLFPNALGLYPTATPMRADGCGLGRHADGIIDELVKGPSVRDLIKMGYLTEYRIFAPPSDLDLSDVSITASGDFSPPKLRTAVHKSHITGDVVSHYLRIAPGKLGVTFAVDIESATEIAANFRANGIPAEVITGKTPDLLRARIMNKFRNREILQLVNVDLLGEGVDVPAIEVVSMARPTESYIVYIQQFGRALRPMPGKTHAIIIDHVGNILRHGLPDAPRNWSLDRREHRRREKPTDVVPIKICLNETCLSAYERTNRTCPFCGFYSAPAARSAPEFVDGDLLELDDSVLAKLRGEINRIDGMPRIPQGADSIVHASIHKRHRERQYEQVLLREQIALWAGYYRDQGFDDSKIYRLFYFTFGLDIMSAQALGCREAEELKNRIVTKIGELTI